MLRRFLDSLSKRTAKATSALLVAFDAHVRSAMTSKRRPLPYDSEDKEVQQLVMRVKVRPTLILKPRRHHRPLVMHL